MKFFSALLVTAGLLGAWLLTGCTSAAGRPPAASGLWHDGGLAAMGLGLAVLVVQLIRGAVRRFVFGGHSLPPRPTPGTDDGFSDAQFFPAPNAGHDASARVVPSKGDQFPTTQPSHDARVNHSISASSPADTEAARGGGIIHDDTAAS